LPAPGEHAPDEAQADDVQRAGSGVPAKWDADNLEQALAVMKACKEFPVVGPYKPGAQPCSTAQGDNVAPRGERVPRLAAIQKALLDLDTDEHPNGVSVGTSTIWRWVPSVIAEVINREKTTPRPDFSDDEFHNAVKAYHDQCLQLLEGKGMSAAEKRKAEAAKSNMDDMVRGQQAAAAAGMNTEHKGPGKRARANTRPASLAGGAASEVEFDLSDDEFDEDEDEAYYDGGRAGDDSPTGVHRAPDANAGGALMPNGAAVLQAALPRVRAPTQPQYVVGAAWLDASLHADERDVQGRRTSGVATVTNGAPAAAALVVDAALEQPPHLDDDAVWIDDALVHQATSVLVAVVRSGAVPEAEVTEWRGPRRPRRPPPGARARVRAAAARAHSPRPDAAPCVAPPKAFNRAVRRDNGLVALAVTTLHFQLTQ
jgi:hypothetical protein